MPFERYICKMNSGELKQTHLTAFNIPKNPLIATNSTLFFQGSCFSENVGTLLDEMFFNILINPFGVMYNMHSIAKSLEMIATGYRFTENDLLFHAGIFLSPYHHGSFKDENADDLLTRINAISDQAKTHLQNCNVAVLTPGTSVAYRHLLTGEIVANCHKIPGSSFDKLMLSEEQTIQSLMSSYKWLKQLNPEIRIVLTLSPVKHLRDGISENALSKARLLSSIHSFLKIQEDVAYFPAFEIMTEELRDHRYYSEDLAHPGKWAVKYIFYRFVETLMDERAIEYVHLGLKYLKMTAHRVISRNEADLQAWENTKSAFIDELRKNYPEMNWKRL